MRECVCVRVCVFMRACVFMFVRECVCVFVRVAAWYSWNVFHVYIMTIN